MIIHFKHCSFFSTDSVLYRNWLLTEHKKDLRVHCTCQYHLLQAGKKTGRWCGDSPYTTCLAMLSTSCLCSSTTTSVPYREALDGTEYRLFFGLASPLGILSGESPPPPSGILVRNLLLLQAWNDRTSSCYKATGSQCKQLTNKKKKGR
jgi:hypothetical protein